MRLALAALALLVLPQEKIELRLKHTKGVPVWYRSTQTTTTEIQGAKIEQEMSMTISMTPTEVDAKGAASLVCKYEGVAVKSGGPQGELDYDSDKDKEVPEDPMAKMMSKLVGQSFTVKMTPSGKVTEVTGFEKIVDAMLQGIGDEAQEAMTKEMMKQMFSDEAFKGMMQQMSPPLPEEKVGKGDTWSTEFTMKMPFVGGMKFALKSKLADLKGTDATIDQDIRIELKPADDKENNPFAGLFEMKEAKGTSTALFSAERGVFIHQKAVIDMVMEAGGNELKARSSVEMKLVEPKKKKEF
jgi:hypothetical protein